MQTLYAQLAEILEVDEVNHTDKVADFGSWDSLAILSTIAMLDTHYGIRVNATDLEGLETVGDLEQLVSERKTRG